MSTPSIAPPTARQAPAKVNLGLHVLRRRADGFHEVETVLLPIGWHDTLTAHRAEHFAFTCSDPAIPTDGRNLCVQAVRAFEAATGRSATVVLHLEKHVPHGAGLGGGSSDAAYTLRLLRDLFAPGLGEEVLHELAGGLGSDVPFFLHDEALLATGRGELLEPLGSEPYRLPFALAVVMPPVQISTAEAYRFVHPHAADRPDLREVICSNDLDRWRRELANDFEAPILSRYPAIAAVRRMLVEAGAGYVALSGSGAAVFGVFEEEQAARATAETARAAGLRAWWEGAAL